VAGVDGCGAGWVVARVEPGRILWSVRPDAAGVLAATAGCAAVGVDIPLGLPVGAERRACDLAARVALGPARSSVFLTPPLEVLEATTHAEACAIARRLTGKAISIQTFRLGAKILDWERGVDRPGHVVEVHPELSFRRLAPTVTFAGKKSARGAGQRIAALTRRFGPALELARLPPAAGLDDAMDALAAAWSAARWARGEADEFGSGRDARGRRMGIAV
jgi:predicted RNase H-like nuclease